MPKGKTKINYIVMMKLCGFAYNLKLQLGWIFRLSWR
jgi:hypothetical protein